MTRKTIWLWANCVVVATLLLASCALAVTEEEDVVPPADEEPAPPVQEEETALAEKEGALPSRTPTEGKLEVHFIDVDQGDSVLVNFWGHRDSD